MASEQLLGLVDVALSLARPTPSFRLALAGLQPLAPEALVGPRAAREMADAAARALEPLDRRTVERTLRDAWGAAPADELDDLEAEPAAVTPTSQVHRAQLDGEAVAVKVLRPGVPDVVRNDLRVLDALARPLRGAFPALDAAAVVRELRERLGEEYDLEHEADVGRRFARGLRGHRSLTAPLPVSRLASDHVLVAAWVDGTPVGALAGAPGAERERAAGALVRFHVGSVRSGTVHADPHPAHALVLADGRTAFLDPGASRRIDPARADLAVAALDALVDGDVPALGRTLHQLGWLPAADGPQALRLGREILGELLAAPALLDVAALVGVRERALARLEEIADLAARATVAPQDLWPLRMLGALALTLAPLAVRADWVALVREAALEGWG